MYVVGITGPTGAGKTTALCVIQELGGQIADADGVYHRLLQTNTQLKQEIEQRFGAVSGKDGMIDRKKLGEIVFSQPSALQDLNQITHKYVIDEIQKQMIQAEQEGISLFAIDAIGLFESGLDKLCHLTVAVLAPPALRVQRIMAREGISEAYAKARVASQPLDSFFREKAQVIFDNQVGSPQAFQAEIRQFFQNKLSNNFSPYGKAE